jgi:Cof subfamily protein (haloacid dehalogenase superfamily)
MRYKMLVCDIDGTLLNSRGQLTEGVKQAVRDAHAAGVVVTLATGRQLRGVLPLVQELGVNVPVVLANGAVIADPLKKRTILHKPLPWKTAHAVLDVIKKHGVWSSVFTHSFEGVDTYFDLDPGFDVAYLFLHKGTPYVQQVEDLKAITHVDPLKVLLLEKPEKVLPIVRDLKNLQVKHPFTMLATEHDFPGYMLLEVFDAGSTKAIGIAQLASDFGITPEEVAAVGDNLNDLEMIEFAGLGTAMGNAAAELKARADWTTKSNDEDGVAHLIRERILV